MQYFKKDYSIWFEWETTVEMEENLLNIQNLTISFICLDFYTFSISIQIFCTRWQFFPPLSALKTCTVRQFKLKFQTKRCGISPVKKYQRPWAKKTFYRPKDVVTMEAKHSNLHCKCTEQVTAKPWISSTPCRYIGNISCCFFFKFFFLQHSETYVADFIFGIQRP